MKEYLKPEAEIIVLTVEEQMTSGIIGGSTGTGASPFGLDLDLDME